MIVDLIPKMLLVSIILICGGGLILISDWRILISAQLLMYLSGTVFLTQLAYNAIAVIVGVVGCLVCIILFLSAYQASWRLSLAQARIQMVTSFDQPTRFQRGFQPMTVFRMMVILLTLLTALALTQQYALLPLSSLGIFIVYWLILVGLFVLILRQNPLSKTQGLFMVLLGFEIWYGVLTADVGVLRGFGMVQLFLALVGGYVVVYQDMPLAENA